MLYIFTGCFYSKDLTLGGRENRGAMLSIHFWARHIVQCITFEMRLELKHCCHHLSHVVLICTVSCMSSIAQFDHLQCMNILQEVQLFFYTSYVFCIATFRVCKIQLEVCSKKLQSMCSFYFIIFPILTKVLQLHEEM